MLSKNVKEKILKIKNLDSKNYLNSFLIHTKFYKDYKSKISIFNSPDKNKKIYTKSEGQTTKKRTKSEGETSKTV